MNTVARSLVVAVVLAMPALVLAQTSELYLNDWQTPKCYVVQGGKIIREFDRSSRTDGPALVVTETIKMIGQDGNNVGREYDLDGAPLSGRYTNPTYRSLYDGATNGERNWSIAHNHFDDFPLVVADADWGNVRVAFVPQRRSSGVTYDAKTDSLWITNNVGRADRIQQYSLDGELMSEFDAPIPGGYGIAWDAADDTLWIPGAFQTTDLFQYDKKGKLLQRLPVEGLPTSILGAEFAFGGGGQCNYTIKKSKAKKGCESCPSKGDGYESEAGCEEKKDCKKRVKTRINCPQGKGTCKIKAKKRKCE